MEHGQHDNRQQIILVACCGPKLRTSAAAADIYISMLFKKARTTAERQGRWFILSALHGLLAPSTIIDPYNVTLKKMPVQKRREWGQKVRGQLTKAGLINLHLVALAGADYVKPLLEAGLDVTQPMKGLRIGEQLQWLNRANAILHPACNKKGEYLHAKSNP